MTGVQTCALPISVDCFVKTNREKDVQRVILVDNEDNELGYSKCTQTGSKVFFNNSMYNYSDYKGVGSVMHLTQIISMLENKLDKIELYSVGDAICFHAKFGFKSDIADNDNLLYFINKEILSLRKSDKRFNSIVKNAQNWVSNTNISGKEKIRQGENIINEYIATINRLKLNNEDNFRMLTGINMCLKKETVLNNKEYYNNLFKKFGIDYQIND